MPGSGLMKIFTTKYPFLWRHFTVFRNRAEPRLHRYMGGVKRRVRDVCVPSLVDDVPSEFSHKQVEGAAGACEGVRVAHGISESKNLLEGIRGKSCSKKHPVFRRRCARD